MKEYKATIRRFIENEKLSLFTDNGYNVINDDSGEPKVRTRNGIPFTQVLIVGVDQDIPETLKELKGELSDVEIFQLAIRTFITNKVLKPVVDKVYKEVGYVTSAGRLKKLAIKLFTKFGGELSDTNEVLKPATAFGVEYTDVNELYDFLME